jgi:hypothetical protein
MEAEKVGRRCEKENVHQNARLHAVPAEEQPGSGA